MLGIAFQLSAEGVRQAIATGGQTAGIFLGLYFATVSVIVSTSYARVPGEVRSLLLRERVGNTYVHIITHLGVVALVLTATAAVSIQPGLATLGYATLLTLLAFVSFVTLGLRAFFFLDPLHLSRRVVHDLALWITKATPTGVGWNDPSFQNHYRKRAADCLTTVENIMFRSGRDLSAQSSALASIGSQLLWALRLYASKKQSIPSDSMWFERVPEHPAWLRASASSVDLALRTGTGLPPQTVPRRDWFENRTCSILQRAFTEILDEEQFDHAHELASLTGRSIDRLAATWTDSGAQELLGAYSVPIASFLAKSMGEGDHTSQTDRIALLDFLCYAHLGVLTGQARRLKSFDAAKTIGGLRASELADANTVHSGDHPRAAIEQLERLSRGLEFERAIEGDVLTPDWYCRQVLALGYMQALDASHAELSVGVVVKMSRLAKSLAESKRYVEAAHAIQRGFEACSKARTVVSELSECIEQLDKYRLEPDIPLPAIALDGIREEVASERAALVQLLATISPFVIQLTPTGEIPDYGGMVYVVIAEECFRCLEKTDATTFSKLFPAFLFACLQAPRHVPMMGLSQRGQVAIATDPLLDLVSLSGYALVYAELMKQDSMRATVAKAWEAALASMKDAKVYLGGLITAVDYRAADFSSSQRDMFRFGWKQALERRLVRAGLLEAAPFASRPSRRPAEKIESPLIQALVRGRSLSYSAEEVFLASHLLGHEKATGLEFPRGVQRLHQELTDADNTAGEGTQL